MIKNIIFTGGGSGGHVMPALTIISKLPSETNVEYIGSHDGIEKEIISKENLPYHSISTGKLRRYLSFQNLLDVFKVLKGILDAFLILGRFNKKESLVFSTGGFVTVPVAIAARLRGIPIFLHEQTSRVGLANKITSKIASKVFISFDSSKEFFDERKVVYSGYPLRDEIFEKEASLTNLGELDFKGIEKDILLVTGGGNGSQLLNNFIKKNMDDLKKRYFIIHQVGKKFMDEFKVYNDESYLSVDFISKEMISLYKVAKVILSRAGAGTVCELMALNKPSIFVPLKIAQRNEQYHNAMEANKKIGSIVVKEDELEFLNVKRSFEKINAPKVEHEETNKAIEIMLNEVKKL